MRSITKIFLFIALLGALISGCKKEEFTDNSQPHLKKDYTVYRIHYTIDSEERHTTVIGEEALDGFISDMMDKARDGHRVSFRDEAFPKPEAYNTPLTFTTADQKKAYSWAEARMKEGYAVSVSYDKETLIYTCIALK